MASWIADAYYIVVALCAVGAFMVSLFNSRGIKEVHVLINSRMTELLALNKTASKAEGVLEEKERNS